MTLNPLQIILISMLSNTPEQTGYTMTKALEGVWKHQQVYRELNKMLASGLVTCEVKPQQYKPDRNCYTVTSAGRIAAVAWPNEVIDTLREGKALPDNLIFALGELHTSGFMSGEDLVEVLEQYGEYFGDIAVENVEYRNMGSHYRFRSALSEMAIAREFIEALV